jgi:hypothetical protein
VALADMNRDGHLDMVFKSGSAVHVKMGDGHGQFPTTKEISLSGGTVNSVDVADLDRDGIPDVVTSIQGSGNGSVAVLDNDGTGQLALARSLTPLVQAVDVAPADFNRDGELDLAVVLALNPSIVSVRLGHTTPPVTTLHLDPASPDGPNGWYSAAPQVGLSVDEPAYRYYQWDWWTPGGYLSYSTTLTAPEGSHTFYYYSVDAADNTETARGEVIKVDSTPPTGTFAIDHGSAYTTTSSIASADSTVTDVGGSGVTTIALSGDTPDAGGSWPYSAHLGMTLTDGDGTKTVVADYTDLLGHTFETSDTIVLDSVAPQGTMQLDLGIPTVPDTLYVTIDSTIVDTTSGMGTMRWSTDGGATWSGWGTYASPQLIRLPQATSSPDSMVRTATVQYKDKAGNVTELSDSITVVDNLGPVGTMNINGGAASTNSLAVTIYSYMVDQVSDMRMYWSLDGGATWNGPFAYAPTLAVNLPTTAAPYDRTRTVTVRYEDFAGHAPVTVSDSINFIRPKASLAKPTVSPSIPRKGKYCTFTGYVAPVVGGSSKLYLYRKVGRVWRRYKIIAVANKAYSSAKNRWTYKWKPPYTGAWYAKAYYAGGAIRAANWSAVKTFTVK